MHPTARWTAQQIIEAFPYDTVPKYLIRDRDGIYGNFFQQRVKNMGIEEVLIAPKSPWQNPYTVLMNDLHARMEFTVWTSCCGLKGYINPGDRAHNPEVAGSPGSLHEPLP
jgi:hypothetical protein